MKKLFILFYLFIAIAIGFAYHSIRSILIDTQPGLMTISNLTVNYIVMSLITGGVCGYYLYSHLLRAYSLSVRLIGTTGGVFVVALLWLAVMSVGGYQTKWI